MLQVWFSGVHANVGGGYPDDGLAHVSLDWMMQEAAAYAGLEFVETEVRSLQARSNQLGVAHDSRAWAGNIYRLDPRNLEQLGNFQKPGFIGTIRKTMRDSPEKRGEDINQVKIARPIIHHSVFDRVKHDGAGYAPINIPADYRVYFEDSSISDLPKKGSVVSSAFESAQEASTRVKFQNVIWNTIWYRKIIYFITLFLFVLFLAYPYLQSLGMKIPLLTALNGSQDDRWVGSIAHTVRAIPGLIGMIPGFGFASAWTQSYEQYPFPFMILFVPVVALMWISGIIAKNASGEMRQVWGHLNGTMPVTEPPSNWSRALADFLMGETYRKIRKGFRILLEFWMSVIFIGFILFGALFAFRIPFFVSELVGAHCEPVSEGKRQLGTKFIFEASDPCFATGITLESGKTYLVEMQINTDDIEKWKDGDMNADLRGWLPEQEWHEHVSAWERIGTDILVTFGIPLRRNLLLPWYQPMARLDQYRFDRYQLKNREDFYEKEELEALKKAEIQHCLRSSITARKTRQLYFYVNDAMFAHHSFLHDFYNNNKGSLEVLVRERPENETLVLYPLCRYGKSESGND